MCTVAKAAIYMAAAVHEPQYTRDKKYLVTHTHTHTHTPDRERDREREIAIA